MKKNKWSVYFAESNGYVKIGITKNIKKRLSQMQTGNPCEIKIISEITNLNKKTAKTCECELHQIFAGVQVKRGWFDILPKFEGYDKVSQSIIYGDGGFTLEAL